MNSAATLPGHCPLTRESQGALWQRCMYTRFMAARGREACLPWRGWWISVFAGVGDALEGKPQGQKPQWPRPPLSSRIIPEAFWSLSLVPALHSSAGLQCGWPAPSSALCSTTPHSVTIPSQLWEVRASGRCQLRLWKVKLCPVGQPG